MPVSVAITRRVRAGREAEFQQALREFMQTSFNDSSVLGVSMIVPPPGTDSREYGILRTFANETDRDAFYGSSHFKNWEQKAQALTEGTPERRELHGLEAWFRSPQDPPPRWKMAVTTLIGVFPTSLLLTIAVAPLIHTLPLLLRVLTIAACMVALLTWVVMPFVTRVLHDWLHPKAQSA